MILLLLIGILIVVVGFVLCFNLLLVVMVVGFIIGLLVGMDFGMLLEIFGEKFVNSCLLVIFLLILLIIGLLEYYGLKECVQVWIFSIVSVILVCILMFYFILCEGMVVLGLIYFGGQVQMVCLLLVLMVEGVVVNVYGEDLLQYICDKIKVYVVVCDNIVVFFGEDIFIVFGVVLLMDVFLKENGIINIELLYIGLWVIFIVLLVLVIYMFCLICFDVFICCDVDVWKVV